MALTLSQQKVLDALRSLAKHGVAETSVRELAVHCGVSRGAAGNALQALEDGKLIDRRSSSSRGASSSIRLRGAVHEQPCEPSTTVQVNRPTVHSNRPQPSKSTVQPSTRTVQNRPFEPSTQALHKEINSKESSSPPLKKGLSGGEDHLLDCSEVDGSEVDGSSRRSFERIAALYPRPEGVDRARRLFEGLWRRDDAPEITRRMLASAELASKMPARFVRFSLANGRGLDWFVREGWRDGWAKLLAIETAELGATTAPGPQPIRPHRECSTCEEGWIYVDGTDAVAPCPECRPAAVAATPRKQPSRSDKLTAVADIAKVVEFER